MDLPVATTGDYRFSAAYDASSASARFCLRRSSCFLAAWNGIRCMPVAAPPLHILLPAATYAFALPTSALPHQTPFACGGGAGRVTSSGERAYLCWHRGAPSTFHWRHSAGCRLLLSCLPVCPCGEGGRAYSRGSGGGRRDPAALACS